MDLAAALERDFGRDWRRGLPLGESGVAAFELRHAVRLPEPYRTFVRDIANGAVGPPAYGLVGLGEPADPSGGHSVTEGSLQEQFPLTEPWVWEGAGDASDDERVALVHRSGSLPLGTDGDAMDYALIVTGPARGQVWMISGEGAIPVAVDFGRWLEGDVVEGARFTLRARCD